MVPERAGLRVPDRRPQRCPSIGTAMASRSTPAPASSSRCAERRPAIIGTSALAPRAMPEFQSVPVTAKDNPYKVDLATQPSDGK